VVNSWIGSTAGGAAGTAVGAMFGGMWAVPGGIRGDGLAHSLGVS